MLIIGIGGGTGSGKTTVVRKIIESLPDNSVAVIPQDSYYNDQSSLPLEVRKQTSGIKGCHHRGRYHGALRQKSA